jgi:large subunit ribosomal protein L31
MKQGIHPTYFTDAAIKCSNCSHIFKTGATQQELSIEICSKCHPFFTGKKVLIDAEGRVDKFRKKSDKATGRKKKARKKLTLEDKVNREITDQIQKEKASEDKATEKKESKKAKKAVDEEIKIAIEQVEQVELLPELDSAE